MPYLELYNFTPGQGTQKPSGSVEYEIDQAGSNEKVLAFSEEVAPIANSSASRVTIEKMFPPGTFVPGTYTLKVTAIDTTGNQTLHRQGNFSIGVE